MDIVKTITGAIIILVLMMAVAIPLIDDMADVAGDNEEQNTGVTNSNRMTKVSKYNSTFAYDGSGGVTINGAASTSGGFKLVGDTVSVYLPNDSIYLQVVYDVSGTATSKIYNSTTAATLTFSESTWTLAESDTVATGTITWAYVPDSAGAYYIGSTPRYIDSDAEITVVGAASAIGAGVVSGTIDDGLDVLYSAGSTTISSATVDYTATDYSNNVAKIVYTMSSSSTVDRNTFVISPVTYQTGPEPETIVPALISLTPVLLLVGLIIGIVGTVIYRRSY